MSVSSGSFQMSASGYTTTFGWNIARQDIAGNYTVINWWFDANWAHTSTVLSTQSAIWVAGSEVHRNGYNTGRYMRGGRIASGQHTLYHDANGNCSFGANGEIAIFTYAVNARGSGWWDLPQIARYVQITNCGDINDDQNPWVNYNNPTGAKTIGWLEFVKNGQLLQGDNGSTRLAYRENLTPNYTFELTQAERDQLLKLCKNDPQMTLRYVVHGSNAPENIHAIADRTYKVINAEPVFKVFDYKDTNTKSVAITGSDKALIAGISTLQVKILQKDKATPKKFATIKSYRVVYGTIDKVVDYKDADLDIDLGTINGNADKLYVEAIDTRNFRTKLEKSINVMVYTPMTIVAEATRKNGFEDDVKLKINGTYDPIKVEGVAKNVIDPLKGVEYRTKATNSTEWSAWKPIPSTSTPSSSTYKCNEYTIQLDKQHSFNIELRTTDKLSSVITSLLVDMGYPAFYIGKDGRISIGDVPKIAKEAGKRGQLEVSGNAYANGNRLLENIAKVIKPEHLDLATSDNNGWLKIPLTDKIAMYLTNNRESPLRTYNGNGWGYVDLNDFPTPKGIKILGGAIGAHHGDSAISVVLKTTMTDIVGTWRNKYNQTINGRIYWSGIIIGEDK
nr:MAG TPA: protein of unknown function DUF859 [Caudoviricetes sp.]